VLHDATSCMRSGSLPEVCDGAGGATDQLWASCVRQPCTYEAALHICMPRYAPSTCVWVWVVRVGVRARVVCAHACLLSALPPTCLHVPAMLVHACREQCRQKSGTCSTCCMQCAAFVSIVFVRLLLRVTCAYSAAAAVRGAACSSQGQLLRDVLYFVQQNK
jgi:hypothetical protein